MSISVKVLHETVVGPLVGNEECRANFAAVGIEPLARIEEHLKHLVVNVVHGVLERDENQLGCFFQRQLTLKFFIFRILTSMVEKSYLECLFLRTNSRAVDKRPCGTWRRSCRESVAGTAARVWLAGNGRCRRIAEHSP